MFGLGLLGHRQACDAGPVTVPAVMDQPLISRLRSHGFHSVGADRQLKFSAAHRYRVFTWADAVCKSASPGQDTMDVCIIRAGWIRD